MSSLPLHAFVFGEQLDGTGRSLGYRLLEPASPQPWSAEVESLARALQATPYPDHWPEVELFCSVLLAGEQRLIAVARYGVTDHTSTRRRGGLELIGVIGPAAIAPGPALQIYRWLRQRRAATDDLPSLGGVFDLADILASLPPDEIPTSVRALPIRSWQDGCLIFAASSPLLPDQRLGLLEQTPRSNWQWLPLCDAGFPFAAYAARGPLVAWTPDLADVALRLERTPPAVAVAGPQPARGWLTAAVVALLLLLAGNLWALWSLPGRLSVLAEQRWPAPPAATPPWPDLKISSDSSAAARENFARALLRALHAGKVPLEQTHSRKELLARYQTLLRQDSELRLESQQTQVLVGLVSVLGERSADQVAQLIQEEFKDRKGYDPEIIRLVSERVRQRLARVESGQ